jgi:hypothetical protein
MKSPALLVTAAGRFFYATAARLLALKFILSMSVSKQLHSIIWPRDRVVSSRAQSHLLPRKPPHLAVAATHHPCTSTAFTHTACARYVCYCYDLCTSRLTIVWLCVCVLLQAAADVLAMASLEVDLSGIQEGEVRTPGGGGVGRAQHSKTGREQGWAGVMRGQGRVWWGLVAGWVGRAWVGRAWVGRRRHGCAGAGQWRSRLGSKR